MYLSYHGHEQQYDGRPRWNGRGGDGQKQFLIIGVPSDYLQIQIDKDTNTNDTSASVLMVSVSTSAGMPEASSISVSWAITPDWWVDCWQDEVTWSKVCHLRMESLLRPGRGFQG